MKERKKKQQEEENENKKHLTLHCKVLRFSPFLIHKQCGLAHNIIITVYSTHLPGHISLNAIFMGNSTSNIQLSFYRTTSRSLNLQVFWACLSFFFLHSHQRIIFTCMIFFSFISSVQINYFARFCIYMLLLICKSKMWRRCECTVEWCSWIVTVE